MTQRTAILLALGLTVFVVVIVGGITMTLQAQAVAHALAAEPTQAPLGGIQNASAEVGLAPTMTSSPTNVPSATPTLTNVPSPTSGTVAFNLPITPTGAIQVALALIPGSKAPRRTPELVNYRGRMAYEVILARAYVYVDAFTGQVLANIAILPPTPTPTEFIPSPTPPPDTGANTGGGNGGGGGGGGGDGGSYTTNPGPTDVPGPQPTPAPKGKKHKKDDGGGGDH